MSDVELEYAGHDYWDRSRPLMDGRVKPEGISFRWEHHPPGMVFGRMARGEFEAGEMSAAFLVMLVDQGVDTLVGLPIITTRGFRHGETLVRTDAGIERPEDLKGKRIGCPDYPRTSTVWVRGLLQHDYGVKASDLEWFQGDEEAGYNDRVRYELPQGYPHEHGDRDHSRRDVPKGGGGRLHWGRPVPPACQRPALPPPVSELSGDGAGVLSQDRYFPLQPYGYAAAGRVRASPLDGGKFDAGL